jgi:hypothetical protein
MPATRAGDRRHPRHQHFEHPVSDTSLIAAIGHRRHKPPADTERALRLAQQQQAAIGRLITALKINCKFLAADGWKAKGKQRIVIHGGCGARLMCEALCRNNDLLRESAAPCHSRRRILTIHA